MAPKSFLALFFATLLSACNSSESPTPTVPTAPAPSYPSVAGTWDGSYTLASCVNTGCFTSSCRFVYDFNGKIVAGDPIPFRFNVQQGQAQLTGAMEMDLSSLFFTTSGTVVGTTDTAGQVTLSGAVIQRDLSSGQAGSQNEILWKTALSADGTSMSGELTKASLPSAISTCTTTFGYTVTATRRSR